MSEFSGYTIVNLGAGPILEFSLISPQHLITDQGSKLINEVRFDLPSIRERIENMRRSGRDSSLEEAAASELERRIDSQKE